MNARARVPRRGRRLATVLATVALIGGAGGAILLLPDSGSTDSPARRAGAVPKEADLAFRQAVVMLHAKQYEHAATALHKVLTLAPAMPEAHVNMGYAMLGMKRPDVARDFFRGAIALRHAQANAHYGLALALADLGDPGAAAAAMGTYLDLAAPGDPYAAKARAAIATWREQGAAATVRP